jgi:hypothetical protein
MTNDPGSIELTNLIFYVQLIYINATFYASVINDECCLSSIDTYESKNQHKHVDEKTGRMHS